MSASLAGTKPKSRSNTTTSDPALAPTSASKPCPDAGGEAGAVTSGQTPVFPDSSQQAVPAPRASSAARPPRTLRETVTTAVALVPSLAQTPAALPPELCAQICREAMQRLAAIDPMLAHLAQANVVRNERRNFLNLRIRHGLLALLWRWTAVPARKPPSAAGAADSTARSGGEGSASTDDALTIGFFMSNSMQPLVQVVPICRRRGVLSEWAQVPLDALRSAVAGFVGTLGLGRPHFSLALPQPGEPLASAERFEDLEEALDYVQGPRCSLQAAFVLTLDLSLSDFQRHLRILRLFSLDTLAKAVEVVQHSPLRAVRPRLRELHPLLPHLVYTRSTVEIQSRFMATVFAVVKDDVAYEFHLSEKLEPYVIIIAIHPRHGKLHWLDPTQLGHLEEALGEFKAKFGIHGESYHYTALAERQATDAFVRSGAAPTTSKAHSSDFHLKMRVATGMVKDRLPVLGLFNFDAVRTRVEPIRYNFSRENMSWPDVKAILLTETSGPSQ